MTDHEMLELVKRSVPGTFEAYSVRRFVLYRNKENGESQEVEVEILDAGPDAGNVRYHVIAKADDGRTATGNPAKSLETALAIVHWSDLD